MMMKIKIDDLHCKVISSILKSYHEMTNTGKDIGQKDIELWVYHLINDTLIERGEIKI